MFLNNRYIDPTTGLFLSVDPLVASTGQPYLYANGSPTTLSDPEGLCVCNLVDGGGGSGFSPLPPGEWVSDDEVIWATTQPGFYEQFSLALGDIAISQYEHVDRTTLGENGFGSDVVASWLAENLARKAYSDGQLRMTAGYLVPSGVGQDPKKLDEWLAYANVTMDECLIAGNCTAGAGDWLGASVSEFAYSAGVALGTFKQVGASSISGGPSSQYQNTTRGRSITNITTDVTSSEFVSNLQSAGFSSTMKPGGVIVLSNGSISYSVYPDSGSTQGPSAQVMTEGGITLLKIRLQPE